MPELENYPQMPPLAQEEIGTFLIEPHVAVISTHNEDGSIHNAPVWYKITPESNEIIFGTQDVSRKIRNIKLNNTVSIYVGKDQMPVKSVLIYGKAILEYDDVINKRIEIFSNYTSPENARMFVESHASKYKPVIVRIKLDETISFDYTK